MLQAWSGFSCDCIESANEDWAWVVIWCRAWLGFSCDWVLNMVELWKLMKIVILLWLGAEHGRALDMILLKVPMKIRLRGPMMIGLWWKLCRECQWKLGFGNSNENWTYFFFLYILFYLDEDGSWDFGCQWRLGFSFLGAWKFEILNVNCFEVWWIENIIYCFRDWWIQH